MKRSNEKRHRPGELVAKLRQSDEAVAEGTPIAEVARSLGVSEVTLHRRRVEYGSFGRVDAPGRLDCPKRWRVSRHRHVGECLGVQPCCGARAWRLSSARARRSGLRGATTRSASSRALSWSTSRRAAGASSASSAP
jgi:hypothetical protein